MNILVLGGLSHLGVNFIKSQHKHYESIVAIDRVSYCSQSKDLILEYCDKFIEFDILKVNLFDVIIWNDIDLVLNAAGSTHVDRSYTRPEEFLRDNIELVRYVMETVSKFPNVRLIHLSTDEVYGDQYESPRSESSMLAPTNFYSSTKASGDMIINSYISTYEMRNVLVLRPNNLLGDYQYPDKVIPLFMKKILLGEDIDIHNYGIQRRCFIPTVLVCDIITELFFREYRWPFAEPFVNVGLDDQDGLSVLELVSLMQGSLGDNRSNLTFKKGRPYNDRHYKVSNDKLKHLLHDSPIVDKLRSTTRTAVLDYVMTSKKS